MNKRGIKKVFYILEIGLLYVTSLIMIGLSYYTHIYSKNDPNPSVGVVVLMIGMFGFCLSKTFHFKYIAVKKAPINYICAGTGAYCIAAGIIIQLVIWIFQGKLDGEQHILMPIVWCFMIEVICCIVGLIFITNEDGEKYER